MQFVAHIICDVNSTIPSRRQKQDSVSATGLETGNNLEDEQMRIASVLSLFPFIFQHPTQSGCLRNGFAEKILKIECSLEGWSLEAECCLQKTETQWNGTEISRKMVWVFSIFVKDEENWALCRTLRDILGKLRDL